MDPEILTEKVATQNKKFLVDLKRNENGYYLKVSEWSNSKKSSIFIPAEGVGRMIEVLRKFQDLIQDGELTEADFPTSRN
ncbi:DNA-binding protein [Leptospira semungkisensis]|uniref:DNA-binding protein n=1 Tax=Leptospira semungkisensis TaxID=2484985 RepID=A0A4R9G2I8_9LEPT|nr:DNA-binding protein [Leptospira semungkisensis]TGK04807.1 DNA-binding protein [Leptospira semungkisensis]